MPAIYDPKYDSNDRAAGVSTIRSDGRVALRKEAGLYTGAVYGDGPLYALPFSVNPVTAMDVFSVNCPLSNKIVRLWRIVLVNPGSATAAALVDLDLGTASAFGSGGGTATARALEGGGNGQAPRVTGVFGGPDPQLSFSAHQGDTTQAAGYVANYAPLVTLSVPAAAGAFTPLVIFDNKQRLFKTLSVTSPSGGVIVLRVPAVGAGAANLRGYAEFSLDDA